MARRCLALLLALLPCAASGQPRLEAWPYSVTALEDGTLEYAFDLSSLATSRAAAEARAALGDAAVKEALHGLPRQARLSVAPGTGLTVRAGRGAEPSPLAAAFSRTPERALVRPSPLGKQERARLLPALHPESPKLLLGADAALWATRALEDATLAALALDTAWLRRQLLTAALARLQASPPAAAGDARVGTSALSARLAATLACGSPERLAAVAPPGSPLHEAALEELSRAGLSLADPGLSTSPDVACAVAGARLAARPFDSTREGAAAALVWLKLVQGEPTLTALLRRLEARQPPAPVSAAWLERAASPQALEDVSVFLAQLPSALRTPPGLLPRADTPLERHLAALPNPDSPGAVEALVAALAEGRVAGLDGPPSLWVQRERALATLAAPGEALGPVGLAARWRARLEGLLSTALGAPVEPATEDASTPAEPPPPAGGLVVRLFVPPAVEVEPVPGLYRALAATLALLEQQLSSLGLTGLKALGPDGKPRGAPAVAEARRLGALLEAAAVLADGPSSGGLTRREARLRLQRWREEPWLARDVRQVVALAPMGRPTALLGVSRRELLLGWAAEPQVRALTPFGALQVDTSPEQRYLVPVLWPVEVPARTSRDASALRALCEAQGRDAQAITAALRAGPP